MRFILIAATLLCLNAAARGQTSTVIFREAGFPVVDSTALSDQALKQGFSSAQEVSSAQLGSALADQDTKVVVLPSGSAYPESAWPEILRYLERGGDLIVLGGKPFTRAAYAVGSHWQLRQPSVAASLELFISDCQQTSGSHSLRFDPNPDIQPQLPSFS